MIDDSMSGYAGSVSYGPNTKPNEINPSTGEVSAGNKVGKHLGYITGFNPNKPGGIPPTTNSFDHLIYEGGGIM